MIRGFRSAVSVRLSWLSRWYQCYQIIREGCWPGVDESHDYCCVTFVARDTCMGVGEGVKGRCVTVYVQYMWVCMELPVCTVRGKSSIRVCVTPVSSRGILRC